MRKPIWVFVTVLAMGFAASGQRLEPGEAYRKEQDRWVMRPANISGVQAPRNEKGEIIESVVLFAMPFDGDGRCPVCRRGGKRSTVTVGISWTTAMGTMAYYDEDGKYHYFNPNTTTTSYECSNGHAFSVGSNSAGTTVRWSGSLTKSGPTTKSVSLGTIRTTAGGRRKRIPNWERYAHAQLPRKKSEPTTGTITWTASTIDAEDLAELESLQVTQLKPGEVARLKGARQNLKLATESLRRIEEEIKTAYGDTETYYTKLSLTGGCPQSIRVTLEGKYAFARRVLRICGHGATVGEAYYGSTPTITEKPKFAHAQQKAVVPPPAPVTYTLNVEASQDFVNIDKRKQELIKELNELTRLQGALMSGAGIPLSERDRQPQLSKEGIVSFPPKPEPAKPETPKVN